MPRHALIPRLQAVTIDFDNRMKKSGFEIEDQI
jgi:hypothetical protein